MPRIKWATRIAVVVAVASAAGVIAQEKQEKGGGDETGAYQVVENWLKPRPGREENYVSSSIVAIFAESPNRVFVVQRGELPLPMGVKPGPGAFFAMATDRLD